MLPASADNRGLQKEVSLRVSTGQQVQVANISHDNLLLLLYQERYQKVYDVPNEVEHHQGGQLISAVTPNNGTLLPPVATPLHRGGKLISFDIERWGFKDDVIKVYTQHIHCRAGAILHKG